MIKSFPDNYVIIVFPSPFPSPHLPELSLILICPLSSLFCFLSFLFSVLCSIFYLLSPFSSLFCLLSFLFPVLCSLFYLLSPFSFLLSLLSSLFSVVSQKTTVGLSIFFGVQMCRVDSRRGRKMVPIFSFSFFFMTSTKLTY